MRKIDRSALVSHSAKDMFALVNDIAAYPIFLPWCRETKIVRKSESQVEASLHIVKSGINRWFTTRNTVIPEKKIELDLVDGPFDYLRGNWQFHDLDKNASKVSLQLEYRFSNAVLGFILGPVFNHICDSLVDAFIKRADHVYRDS